jgi:hypothetical protein
MASVSLPTHTITFLSSFSTATTRERKLLVNNYAADRGCFTVPYYLELQPQRRPYGYGRHNVHDDARKRLSNQQLVFQQINASSLST